MFPENNCLFVTGVACRTPAEYKCNGARTLIILSETALPCPPCLGVCAFSGLEDPTCYSCFPECHPSAHTTIPNPLTRGRIWFILQVYHEYQVWDGVANLSGVGDGNLVLEVVKRGLGDELLPAGDGEGQAGGELLWVKPLQGELLRVEPLQGEPLWVRDRWKRRELCRVHNHRLLGRGPRHICRLPCWNSRSYSQLVHSKCPILSK